MKKLTFSFLLLTCCLLLCGQNPKNAKRVNSRSLMNKSHKYFEEKEYDSAESLLLQIPPGDSLYAGAQYELAYLYYTLEEYDKVEKILLELINSENRVPNNSATYNLLGNTLSNTKNFDRSLYFFNKGLEKYPYNHLLMYNKGVLFLKQEKYVYAAECFEKSLFFNPIHQSSHFQLGIAYLNMGLTIQGILALNYAVLNNPSNQLSLAALQLLESLYKNGISETISGTSEVLPERYQAEKKRQNKLEAIVRANIYMQKGFKPLSKINHPIVSQNQIIFENVTAAEGEKDIVNFLYIPYFKTLLNNSTDFNTYSYLILGNTNLNNNKVKTQSEKMLPALKELTQKAGAFLNSKTIDGIGQDNPEGFTYSYNENYILNSFGVIHNRDSEEALPEGLYTRLNNNGSVISREFYRNGIMEDTAYYYYDEMIPYQIVPMKEGQIHGTAYLYFRNLLPGTEPVARLEIDYEYGEIDGYFREYSPSGALLEKSYYANGSKEGESFHYYNDGQLKSISHFVLSEYSGEFFEFYPNGDTASAHYFPPSEHAGKGYSYYPNGTILSEASLEKNEYAGPWKKYYCNGKLAMSGNQEKESKEGAFREYYPNGNLHYEYFFINNQLEGEYNTYSPEGIKLATGIYEKGRITQAIIYNADGSVKETVNKDKNSLTYRITNTYGIPLEEEQYTLSKNYLLKHIYFWNDGSTKYELKLKNQQLDGLNSYYYPSGKMQTCTQYKEDVAEGISLSYFPNDTLSEEGFYANGHKIGTWYYYYPDGNLYQKSILGNDGSSLFFEVYTPDGNPSLRQSYINDLPHISTTFDETGNVLKTDTIVNGNGFLRSYYLNGNTESVVPLKGGLRNGILKKYDFNGYLIDTTYYIEDFPEGEEKMRNELGTLTIRAHYRGGELDGKYYIYHSNGNLQKEVDFTYGEINGTSKEYFFNGALACTTPFSESIKDGIVTFYAPDGKSEAYKLRFENGRMVEYAYTNKEGKMTAYLPYRDEIGIEAFYRNGTPLMTSNYKNGVLHGIQTVFYPGGEKMSEYQYDFGEFHGRYNEWFTNGNPRCSYHFNYGNKEGNGSEYYENGQLHYQNLYINDMPHGERNVYAENGELIRTQTFYYGTLKNDIKHK